MQPLRFDSILDVSDTWVDDLYSFGEQPCDLAIWDNPAVVESGPLMASMVAQGRLGDSTLRAEWRVYAEDAYAEPLPRWRERRRVLKLTLPFDSALGRRTDGIMAGSLVRPNKSHEWPLRDWKLLEGENGRRLRIVCPDVYSVDATDKAVRLTLLHSPVIVLHMPAARPAGRREFRPLRDTAPGR